MNPERLASQIIATTLLYIKLAEIPDKKIKAACLMGFFTILTHYNNKSSFLCEHKVFKLCSNIGNASVEQMFLALEDFLFRDRKGLIDFLPEILASLILTFWCHANIEDFKVVIFIALKNFLFIHLFFLSGSYYKS
jgi:hypothetical protein